MLCARLVMNEVVWLFTHTVHCRIFDVTENAPHRFLPPLSLASLPGAAITFIQKLKLICYDIRCDSSDCSTFDFWFLFLNTIPRVYAYLHPFLDLPQVMTFSYMYWQKRFVSLNFACKTAYVCMLSCAIILLSANISYAVVTKLFGVNFSIYIV